MRDWVEIRAEPVSEPGQLALTFPAFRELARSGDAVSLCAWAREEAIGLALARVSREDRGEATLLSIAVKGPWRRQGLGTRLLGALEEELRRRGCRRVGLTYVSGNPSTPAVERMLSRHGWQTPQARMMICYSTIDRLVQGDWVRTRMQGHPSIEIFPWRELDSTERTRLAGEDWFPGALSPFRDEEKIEGQNSIGIRKAGRLAGWFLTHRIAPDTIRYSNLFLRPEIAGRGLGFAVAAESVRLHAGSDLARQAPNCTTDFSPGNAMMANFVRKRLLPTLTATRISMGSHKLL
jgi:GNAT superfamily N-acetyltransferase